MRGGPKSAQKYYVGFPSPIGPGDVVIYYMDGATGKSESFDVTIPLDPCHRYVNHSPDGFSWGYGGSGPSQLAFAILFDATDGDLDTTRSLYMDFKRDRISHLDQNSGFEITKEEVLEWIRMKQA